MPEHHTDALFGHWSADRNIVPADYAINTTMTRVGQLFDYTKIFNVQK